VGETIKITGVGTVNDTGQCVTRCRWCAFGNIGAYNLTAERISAVLERLIEWRDRNRPSDYKVSFRWGRSFNFDIKTLVARAKLYKRVFGGMEKSIPFGGIYFKPDDQLRTWLLERKDIGIEKIVASFAGTRDLHDKWAGKKGEFDQLVRASWIAGEIDIEYSENLFLTKSTLPLLDELMDLLDAIPGRKSRTIGPVHYRGRAQKMEDERITEDIMRHLPGRINEYFHTRNNMKKERDWMEMVSTGDQEPIEVELLLFIDSSNMDWIEATPMDDIMADLEIRTRRAYAVIPTIRELCERHGDRENTRMYSFGWELEKKWLNSYLREYPIDFEGKLTRFFW
jgi:hypothetical protein